MQWRGRGRNHLKAALAHTFRCSHLNSACLFTLDIAARTSVINKTQRCQIPLLITEQWCNFNNPNSSQQKHVQCLFVRMWNPLYHFTCQGFTSIACKTAALLHFADHWLLILLSAAGICFYFLLREQEHRLWRLGCLVVKASPSQLCQPGGYARASALAWAYINK